MLIAGMDISGDEDSGEQKYIAIIVGQENSIYQLSSRIGSTQVHMANLPPALKEYE